MSQAQIKTSAVPDTAAQDWWRGATIYQIYPRSFADSNGDGIGDLNGIMGKLEHIAGIGADAIWISPFFTSPMKDFGYDVSNYCDVDPIFGTLDDFDRLVTRAHALGLRVLIDQVYSHTSDEHAWFAESRQSKDNPKADWYVWADAKPDGSPPNNWQSVFGGPAWTWDARRGQYYMHNFLGSQPQMHCHNSAVQDALLSVAKFWLDRGVDGFRVDAINFAMHNPELTDNPPAPPSNTRRTRPFDFQLKINNQSHPDIPIFIERLRALTDSYDNRFTLAEVGGDDADREMKLFTQGGIRFNSAYSFAFLYAQELTPSLVREAIEAWPDDPESGWPSWAFENHDAPRAVSRWTSAEYYNSFARAKIALLAALRGNIILFQGEELALLQDDIPFELLQDPEAIANWPLTLSRDGVRTPMPWEAQGIQGGFTIGTPWLPFSQANLARAVDRQEDDPQSLLNLTRNVIALRQQLPTLKWGSALCQTDGDLLILDRIWQGACLRCIFNLGTSTIDLGQYGKGAVIFTVNNATTSCLPPYGVLFVERDNSV